MVKNINKISLQESNNYKLAKLPRLKRIVFVSLFVFFLRVIDLLPAGMLLFLQNNSMNLK